MSLYRARWHIELLFKRIKQLLNQHCLRAETQETAVATVYAILVSWLLQQQVALEMRALLNEMYLLVEEEKQMMSQEAAQQDGTEEPAISEWQLQALSVDLLRKPSARRLESAASALLPAQAAQAPGRTPPQTSPSLAAGQPVAG